VIELARCFVPGAVFSAQACEAYWVCDRGPKPLILKGELQEMKKIMSLMLGLALLSGTATVVFSQDTDKEKEGKKDGKKGGKKGTDSTDKTDKKADRK
jgi:hypothetical protein